MAKTLSIASPSLVQVARAAKQCDLTVLVEERDAAYPAHWFLHDDRSPNGRQQHKPAVKTCTDRGDTQRNLRNSTYYWMDVILAISQTR
ncbi:MAG: hypothetical protein LBU24_04665 [Methanocalculaceae archaeon]|nr:hypothetical protein [Methanocalculaceae archaeon]